MIAYLEGPLVVKTPAYVVIDVHGVGYDVHISLHTYEKIANLEKVRLLTHFIVKEDGHSLFGFFAEDERKLFRHLISISGVGPNTARQMLSSLPPNELRNAIIQGDVSFLKTVKGIGPKSAQRIIVELQDVLKKDMPEGGLVPVQKATKITEEATAAMIALGFPRATAEKAVSKVLREHKEVLTVEELIKQALKAI